MVVGVRIMKACIVEKRCWGKSLELIFERGEPLLLWKDQKLVARRLVKCFGGQFAGGWRPRAVPSAAATCVRAAALEAVKVGKMARRRYAGLLRVSRRR